MDTTKKQAKDNQALVWHPGYEPYPTPSERGFDIHLLLKVEDLPVPYLTAAWDGHKLYTFSTFGYPDSPWTSFPEGIKIESWAVLK